MATRTITLRAFCSAKGGVGKSALAVTAAKLLAAHREGAVVLVDADMTGTSLVDGLRLCAPEVKLRADGAADLYAEPTGDFLSRDDTLKQREGRRRTGWEAAPPPPPFLNDILTATPDHDALGDSDAVRECCLQALSWQHEQSDRVRYFPSSPIRADICVAMSWLYEQENHMRPFPWIRRVAWMIEGIRAQMPNVTDIVLDLPPNLVGFSYEALAFLAHLMQGKELPPGYPQWHEGSTRWRAQPILVTTPDRNDLFAAMDYVLEHKSRMPRLEILVNRTESLEVVRAAVRERYGDAAGAERLIRRHVPELRLTLGSLFRGGNLALVDEIVALARALGLDDGQEEDT